MCRSGCLKGCICECTMNQKSIAMSPTMICSCFHLMRMPIVTKVILRTMIADSHHQRPRFTSNLRREARGRGGEGEREGIMGQSSQVG